MGDSLLNVCPSTHQCLLAVESNCLDDAVENLTDPGCDVSTPHDTFTAHRPVAPDCDFDETLKSYPLSTLRSGLCGYSPICLFLSLCSFHVI
jgi:hypothetical protein